MVVIAKATGLALLAAAAVIAGIVVGTRQGEVREPSPPGVEDSWQQAPELPIAEQPSDPPEADPPAQPPDREQPADPPEADPPADSPDREQPADPPEAEPPADSPGRELPAPSHGIPVLGDDHCVGQTSEALTLLMDLAPGHYENVVERVGLIECVESGSGAWVWEDPPRVTMGRATVEAGTVWYAGAIAHEACHIEQYQGYAVAHPSEFVPEDVYYSESAEAECLDVQYDALTEIGAGQEQLDYVRAVLETRYWDVDYEGRWW